MINLCIASRTAIHHHFYFTGFQGDCLTDNDCRHIQNSYCDKQVEGKYQCACNDNFIFVLNNTSCLTSKILIILTFSHKRCALQTSSYQPFRTHRPQVWQ